ALYALDVANSQLFRFSPRRNTWIDEPDVIPHLRYALDALHAVVALPSGVAYAGEKGPAWVNLPMFRGEAQSEVREGETCLGAPARSDMSRREGLQAIYWPVLSEGKLALTSRIAGKRGWQSHPVEVVGEPPSGNLMFAPPVNAAGNQHWISREGVL